MPAALVLRSRLKSFSSLLVPVSRLPPVLWSPTRPAAIVRPSRPSHEVFSPFDDFRCGKRPTPGLPPSASLRPQVFSTSRRLTPSTPFRPCFMPIPSRFSPSESPPDASLACLSAPSAPLAVSRHVLGHTGPTPGIHAIARSVPFRSVLPKNRRPFLSWCSPLRGFPRSVSTSLKTSPLMGFNMTLPSNRSSRPSSCLLCRVSKNREVDELFRAQLPPWGFQSSAPAKAGALRTPSGNALSR